MVYTDFGLTPMRPKGAPDRRSGRSRRDRRAHAVGGERSELFASPEASLANIKFPVWGSNQR